MADVYYTLAEWRVRPGREQEFIRAWEGLGEAFSQLPSRPRWGRLLQNQSTPTLFYSFGEWPDADQIQAGLNHPTSQQALDRVRALCESGTPGVYRQVKEIILEK